MTIGSGHKQIGQLLLQAGVIDDLQLRSALGHQRQWGGRLGRILVELKFLDENTLAATLARQLGLESTRITFEGVDPKVVALVPQTVAERYWIFPLSFKDSKGGGELTVAVSDPTNLASVEDVRFHTGKRIKVVVAPESDIEGAIKRFYYGDAGAVMAVSPPGEEVFASSPTSLGEPEEDLAELEPLPTDSVPSAAPMSTPMGGDALDEFFDGLTPPPPTGGDALFDFDAPVPATAAPAPRPLPATQPPPPPATLPPPPPATLPPSVILDAALGTPPFATEAPAPIRVQASAFDSPQLATLFEPAPPGDKAMSEDGAPFVDEDQISLEMQSAGIPLKTQPVITLVPSLAIAAPYPEAAESEVDDLLFDVGPAMEASPPPSPAEPAFAVDLHVDADSDAPSEGSLFAALAPPLVGTVAPPDPDVATAPLPFELSQTTLEASPMVAEAAVAALSDPEPAQGSSFDEPPLPIANERGTAAGVLGGAPFTEVELQILDSLEARVAGGTEPPQVIKPGQLVSALIRLMIRKGLLAEAELIEELQKL